MALLDGKYEINAQKQLSEQETQFDVTAPDGQALRIIWFDLKTSSEENNFERYRNVLRALKKKDLAAIHDIVSRPATHYVAWYNPKTKPFNKLAKTKSELTQILEEHQFTSHEISLHKNDQDQPCLFNLSFHPDPNIPLLELEPDITPKKEPKTPDKARVLPSWLLSWSLCLLFLVFGSFFFLANFLRQANSHVVTIPALLGLSLQEAELQLADLGLSVETTAISSDKASNTVLSVSPKAGTSVKTNHQLIRLSYAVSETEPDLSVVPQLRGQTFNAAIEDKLAASDFSLGSIVFMHSNNLVNSIISQSSEAGNLVAKNSPISLLVSLGREARQSIVPNLVGLELNDALSTLESLGFSTPDVLYTPSARFPSGSVVSQSLRPYTNAVIGQAEHTIRLHVAGSQITSLSGTKMPSYIGLSLKEAQTLTPATRFSVLEVESPNLPAGIIQQSPAPNSENSSLVEVVVNSFQTPVAIPLPSVNASYKAPEPRSFSYSFDIEQGIGQSLATVFFRNNAGEELLIASQNVAAGDKLEGVWRTAERGELSFVLKLNGIDYKTSSAFSN